MSNDVKTISPSTLGDFRLKKCKIDDKTDNYKMVKLGDYTYIKARIGWRGLSASEYTNEGPYLIASQHIKGSKILWDKCDHLSEYRYDESPEIQLKDGDVIISKDGTIGRLGFIDQMPGQATINGTMMLIRSNNSSIFQPKFLYYYFQGPEFKRLIFEKISGSSVPHIFQRDISNLAIPLIPVDEQCKITIILSTIDTMIDYTDQVIQKLILIKLGLTLELMSKGIRHNDFKETDIGFIPSEWRIFGIREIFQDITEKSNDTEKFPIFSLTISDGLVPKPERYERRFLLKKQDEYGYKLVTYGDIVFNPMNLRFGAISISNEKQTIAVSSYYNVIRQKDGNINPWFYAALFKTNKYHNIFENYAKGSLIEKKRVHWSVFNKILVPLPSYIEQNKIVEILSLLNYRIELEKKYHMHLVSLKKSLMIDLFIGKVRMKVDSHSREVPSHV